ncbi:uncharacterized protein LOC125374645 [Haliotis rufescens]|uniref:uncharacterized protein LOC125374645 n=1 Tax=Haliotis rufescens TaxID=6454 RepID=UPI00201F69CA|nr:uncharacterized protein LOC125374645 [Haliotis rufescens]
MKIHRGSMTFLELCGYFNDPTILGKIINIVRVLANGGVEQAEDTGGVLKDTLAEFGETFYSYVDSEELIECLDTHECRTHVNKKNIVAVLLEIAHKELLQTPMFVSKGPLETDVAKYLRRYVKQLDQAKLRQFLRYCTDSDLLIVDRITVEMISMKPCNVSRLDSHEDLCVK